MRRQEISDNDWAKIQPMLPSNDGRGRDYRDHRQVLCGIIWAIRTGAPWRDIPERFGPWNTCYSRHRRWTKSGLWQRMFQRLNRLRNEVEKLDWTAHFIDGTSIRAHQKAAGGSPFDEALGVSRGGYSTKVHLRIDRDGHLMHIEVTPGQDHELNHAEALMNGGAVRQPCGRPKLRPQALVGDKGYSANWFRKWAHNKHMAAVIPRSKNETRKGPFQKDLYRERELIERTIGRFKEYRRVAFRFEKLSEQYKANWLIVEILRGVREIDRSL